MDAKQAATAIEEKIRALPEDCLKDIAAYIDFIIYRRSLAATGKGGREGDAGRFFGKSPALPDGLTLQKEARHEWD
ncbi:MAG: hypothetical protein J6333_03060 [Planctomycetes bacterium]|nr:hypothetical protein [Planctomycetota bacterium]